MTSKFTIRKALINDLPTIVRLLTNDPLGAQRESYQNPLPQEYYVAFAEIHDDKNQFLLVIEDQKSIIGTLQLTIITNITYRGGKRGQIEGVRVDETYRGKGVGRLLIEWAINKAREMGCHLIQLTTDKKRPEAVEFYKKLGFVPSHEGLKLHFNHQKE